MVGEVDSPLGGGKVAGTDDPVYRPLTLPSSGLYYGQHDGTVLIRPTRGDEEEMLAGIPEEAPQARVAMFRTLAERCSNLRGVGFYDLTIPDFTALLFNFFAIVAGDDRIKLTPTHTALCGPSPQVKHLTELRYVKLARAEAGLDVNWPAKAKAPTDAVMDAIKATENPTAEEGAVVTRVLDEKDIVEPFTVKLPTGEVVQYRMLRLSDLVKSEEFIAAQVEQGGGMQAPGASVRPEGALHNYLLARLIVSLNGARMTPLQAAVWVRKALTPTLNVLRADIARREYGYDLIPRFKCAKCGQSFRVRLPIDTNFFRGGDDAES
jgi:hypothetical protein